MTAPSLLRVALLGGSGHAKVVISALQSKGRTILEVRDDDPAKWGHMVSGVSIGGGFAEADEILEASDVEALIAIGSNAVRKSLALRFARARWTTAVHRSAVVDATAVVEPGAVVFAGAVLQPETRIGAHVIVNTGATVDHDCVIGAFAHLGPGCHLAGHVTVGEGTLIGTGAAVIPGINIGAWATIGAGAAVTRDVPDGARVGGVPAKQLE